MLAALTHSEPFLDDLMGRTHRTPPEGLAGRKEEAGLAPTQPDLAPVVVWDLQADLAAVIPLVVVLVQGHLEVADQAVNCRR